MIVSLTGLSTWVRDEGGVPSFTQQQAGAAVCLLRVKAGGVRQPVCVCQCVQVCLQEVCYQILHDGRMQMGRDVPSR